MTSVVFDHDYYAAGKLLGRLCRPALRRRIRQTEGIRKLQKIPLKEMLARAADFTRLLARVAPPWLEEAAGLARGAGVRIEDLLMLNCLPRDFYPAGGGCTSLLEIGRDENRLFKIRDERNHTQLFYIRQLPRGVSLQVGHDAGNLGFAHCFSGAPLAGANNTGSHVRAANDNPVLDDCHVLRFIAERARNTGQIPRIFDRLIGQKVFKGAGHGRGAIFLFADARRGLIVECDGSNYTSKFIERGRQVRSNHFILPPAVKWAIRPPNANTLRRRQRMQELLQRCHRPPLVDEILALARDRENRPDALCNDDSAHSWMTISAQLHVIDRKCPPQSVNYVCCGNPRLARFLAVPIAQRRSPVQLAGGAYYEASNRLYLARKRRARGARDFLADLAPLPLGRGKYSPSKSKSLSVSGSESEMVGPDSLSGRILTGGTGCPAL